MVRSAVGRSPSTIGIPMGKLRRILLCPVLIALLIVPVGCGQRAGRDDPYDLSITVEKGFVKRQTPYVWFPTRDDSLFSGILGGGDDSHLRTSSSGGGSITFDGGHDGGAMLVVIAAIVAVVVVAATVDVTYHHVHGLQLALTVEGNDLHQVFPLRWGENRVLFPRAVRARLDAGTAVLFLDASGTRHAHMGLPISGVDWGRRPHVVSLTAAGDCFLDERQVGVPGASR